MEMLMVKIPTGPCAVKQYAQFCRDAGFTVEIEGTEAIYLKMPKDANGWGILPSCMELDKKVGFNLSKGAHVI